MFDTRERRISPAQITLACALIVLGLCLPAHAEEAASASSSTEPPVDETVAAATHPPVTPEIVGPAYFGGQFEERLLNLGTEEKFEILERQLIKDQVKTFIPPLLVPTIGNHAFVLPPGLFQIATSFRFTNLSGDDFFKKGEVNPVDRDKGTRRQFLTTSIRYGFDLNRKFLHSFTAVLNIPWQNSISSGDVLQTPGQPISSQTPNGDYRVNNGGSAAGLGDISFFIKKKLWDQANFPIGLAIGAGVFFPTGSNEETVGDNGCITVDRETTTDETARPIGAVNPDGATCGTGRVMFRRFSEDGRFPMVLQPGKGTFSYQIGAFGTRQFLPGDMPDFLAGTSLDRGVIHFGAFHRFNGSSDGISAGDLTGAFFTGLVPVYKDYVSLQVGNVNFFQQADSYEGMFKFPGTDTPVQRPSFSEGWTSLAGPGLIFSPDPVVRMTLTAMFRVKAPELGPAPPFVVNLGASFVF